MLAAKPTSTAYRFPAIAIRIGFLRKWRSCYRGFREETFSICELRANKRARKLTKERTKCQRNGVGSLYGFALSF